MRPVMPAARNQANAVVIFVDRQAITIPLNLQKPVRTLGGRGLQKSERRLDAVGHRIKWEMRLLRISSAASSSTKGLFLLPEERLGRWRLTRTLDHAKSSTAIA